MFVKIKLKKVLMELESYRIHKKRLQYSFNDRSKSKRGRKINFLVDLL